MATWLMHLRVADTLFDALNITSPALFFAGSIAPDCGTASENWSIPIEKDDISKITHWSTSGDKRDCDYEKFYNKYICNKSRTADTEFYLGYYVHLITDVEWTERIAIPLFEQENPDINSDMIKKVKQSWRNFDALFIKNNPDYRPLAALFKTADLRNRWLDYYSDSAVQNLAKYVCSYYKKQSVLTIDKSVQYLSDRQVSCFVKETVKLIKSKIYSSNEKILFNTVKK